PADRGTARRTAGQRRGAGSVARRRLPVAHLAGHRRMSKPGSIPWLMSHELRLFWRRGKMKPKSGLILVGFLMTLWLLFSFFIFQRLGPDIPPPPFVNGPGDGLMLTGVGIIIAFMGSVMLAGAILAAVDVIYTRNDLDLLLSSPVSP